MNNVELVQARIDNLLNTADQFDVPGGSRALATRCRDKASGMETALRMLTASPTTEAPTSICVYARCRRFITFTGGRWLDDEDYMPQICPTAFDLKHQPVDIPLDIGKHSGPKHGISINWPFETLRCLCGAGGLDNEAALTEHLLSVRSADARG